MIKLLIKIKRSFTNVPNAKKTEFVLNAKESALNVLIKYAKHAVKDVENVIKRAYAIVVFQIISASVAL